MKLPLLTTSSKKVFDTCPRLYYFKYVLGYRTVGVAFALADGTLWHKAMEMWWLDKNVDSCVTFIQQHARDEWVAAKFMALMRGYHELYKEQKYVTLEIEETFTLPIKNPYTGETSQHFLLGGRQDALAEDDFSLLQVVEHKTTSLDISPGGAYWQRLRLDAQVSNYIMAAEAASGREVGGVLYDVVRKPQLRPFKATPLAKRFTKKGGLRKGAHEFDETPTEFYVRVLEELGEHPHKYYQRAPEVRFEADEKEAMFDLWATAERIHFSEEHKMWPRNTESCFKFNRPCDFFDVCTKRVALENELHYRKVEQQHEELT